MANTQKFKTVTDFLYDAWSGVLPDTSCRLQKAWLRYPLPTCWLTDSDSGAYAMFFDNQLLSLSVVSFVTTAKALLRSLCEAQASCLDLQV